VGTARGERRLYLGTGRSTVGHLRVERGWRLLLLLLLLLYLGLLLLLLYLGTTRVERLLYLRVERVWRGMIRRRRRRVMAS
jgi:hypothetical protein